MRKIKSEVYKGITISFDIYNGCVGARAFSLSPQYLSIEKTKTKTFEEIKPIIDNLLKYKVDDTVSIHPNY